MSNELPNISAEKTQGGVLALLERSISAHMNEVDPQFRGNYMYYQNMALAAHRRFEAICKHSGLDREQAIALRYQLPEWYKRSGKARFSFETHFLNTLPNEFNVRGRWVPEHLQQGVPSCL